jgi:diacylglycerol kinase family enzyme
MRDKMRICFIYNPGSGSGNSRGRKALAGIEDWLASHPASGHTLHVTKILSDAERLALEAHAQGYERIVAVGGDGTINGVLNSFFDTDGRPRSATSMGVVYTGTSPDFCKSYNIPLDPRAALAVVTAATSVRPIPVAEIELQREHSSNTTYTRRFACCANIGIGPELARRANSGARHRWGDLLGTFFSLLALLRTFRPLDLDLLQDGQPLSLERTTNVFLGLTRHVASGLQVAHDLDRYHGCLYKLAITGMRLRDIPRGLLLLYGGRPPGSAPPFALDYFREIEIRHDQGPAEVEFDGDPAGFLPCKVRLGRHPLPLCVPERSQGSSL